MKKTLIILSFFIFGCENLEEQVSPLSGIYYVFEGWDKFMGGDYDRAKELFSATLLADEGSATNYYDHAYVGLGWTAIYKANVSPGIVNKSVRENLRNEAIDHFESAYDLVNVRIVSKQMSASDTIVYANVLAGKTFNKSYLALEKAMEFYTDGLDSSVWVETLLLSSEVISESDILLIEFIDYDFIYDPEINVNDIRILRAQSYIRLGEMENAATEIELMTDFNCDLSQISIIECLYSSGLNP